MDADDPFESPKLLLARAEENLVELNRRAKAFFDRKPYARIVEIDPESGHEFHKIRITAKLPGNLKPVYADAVNNLRHALDQAVCASAIALGVTNLKNVYFPVAESEDQIDAVIKSRCRNVPAEVVTYLRGLKPYKRHHSFIWALSKMAATNKHQALSPVAAHSEDKIGIDQFDGLGKDAIPWPKWDGAKNEFTLVRMRRGAKVNYRLSLSFQIQLDEPEAELSGPAIPLLHLILSEVARIVAGIEEATARALKERAA